MKSINFSVFLILCFYNVIIAQSEKNENQFGINVSSNMAYQIFENTDDYDALPTLGLGVGVDYFIPFADKSVFKTGISYYFRQISFKDYNWVFGCDIDPLTGTDAFSSWREPIYSAHFIGVVLEYQYHLLKGKESFYLKIGFEPQYKIKESLRGSIIECMENLWDYGPQPKGDLTNLALPINFGFGIEVKMKSKMRIYLEPQVGYYFTKPFKDVSPEENSRLINMELRLGVKF